MKTKNFKNKTIIGALTLVLFISSCTLTRTVEDIYSYKTDATDLYFGEKEVTKDYKVIGYVQYERALVSSFSGISAVVMGISAPTFTKAKRCVKRLQKKAKLIGGDAIIMTTMHSAVVIKYKK